MKCEKCGEESVHHIIDFDRGIIHYNCWSCGDKDPLNPPQQVEKDLFCKTCNKYQTTNCPYNSRAENGWCSLHIFKEV